VERNSRSASWWRPTPARAGSQHQFLRRIVHTHAEAACCAEFALSGGDFYLPSGLYNTGSRPTHRSGRGRRVEMELARVAPPLHRGERSRSWRSMIVRPPRMRRIGLGRDCLTLTPRCRTGTAQRGTGNAAFIYVGATAPAER
jgi:hypothetical protein